MTILHCSHFPTFHDGTLLRHPPSIRKLRPDPIPGLSCELGFMGSVLSIELPQDERQQQQPLQVTPPGVLDTDLPVRLYQILQRAFQRCDQENYFFFRSLRPYHLQIHLRFEFSQRACQSYGLYGSVSYSANLSFYLLLRHEKPA